MGVPQTKSNTLQRFASNVQDVFPSKEIKLIRFWKYLATRDFGALQDFDFSEA